MPSLNLWDKAYITTTALPAVLLITVDNSCFFSPTLCLSLFLLPASLQSEYSSYYQYLPVVLFSIFCPLSLHLSKPLF